MTVVEETKEAAVVNRPTSEKGAIIEEKYADVTLRLLEDHGDEFGPMSPEKERKLKFKLYWNVMGLVCAANLLLFIDKSTLGYSSLLGLFEETHITKAQYNNLGTFFYVGYLVFQWPGHYLIQRLPLGKVVSGLMFTWGSVVLLHCVAIRYGGLIVLRLALGACESVVVPAIEMTLGMFFNRYDFSFLQPVFWITCNIAPLVCSFLSYGLLFSKSSIHPWKFFMIISGGASVLLSVYSWFYYPDNPATAKFLTLEEKVYTIKRVHESSQSSIEQKQFKRSQFIETLKDPVSWLFCLQAFTLMYANNLTYGQQNLLIKQIGVGNLGSTLVAAAGAGFGIAMSVVCIIGLRWWPSNLALHCFIWCIGGIAGGIGMVTVNWERKKGLLACLLLAGHTYGNAYIIALGWTSSSAAGYTKKLMRNVLFMLGYSVGNLVSPQIWVPHDAPRYYGAWISQIVISWVGTPLILFIIHIILSRRNKQRKAWAASLTPEQLVDAQFGEVEQLGDDGQTERRKVPIAALDLTDLQNPLFIYPI